MRGFKRDYGLEETAFDEQSCHRTRTAGSVYARGLEEAASHIETRKSGYRKISQERHACSGFLPRNMPSRTEMARLRPAIFEQRIDMYEAVGQLMRVKVSKPLLLCVYQISRVRYRTRLYGRRSTPGYSSRNKACVRHDPIVS